MCQKIYFKYSTGHPGGHNGILWMIVWSRIYNWTLFILLNFSFVQIGKILPHEWESYERGSDKKHLATFFGKYFLNRFGHFVLELGWPKPWTYNRCKILTFSEISSANHNVLFDASPCILVKCVFLMVFQDKKLDTSKLETNHCSQRFPKVHKISWHAFMATCLQGGFCFPLLK